MQKNNCSFINGIAFSATWVILYSICSVLYWASPGPMLTFTTNLFHGLNFTSMAAEGSSFTFGMFASSLFGGAIYTFVAGMLFSLIQGFFLRLAERKTAAGCCAKIEPAPL